MTLLKPTLGEMWDRLTVLTMKLQHAEASGNEEAERKLNAEYQAISAAMEVSGSQVHLPLILRLAAVNGRLWQLHEGELPKQITLELALQLNGQRLAAVREIDQWAGEESAVAKSWEKK